MLPRFEKMQFTVTPLRCSKCGDHLAKSNQFFAIMEPVYSYYCMNDNCKHGETYKDKDYAKLIEDI